MAEAKKTTGHKAIADVAHPGKSAPSDTSKSIITHRPMMKDPMVVEDDDKLEETIKKPLSKKSGGAKIEPPSVPEPKAKVDDDKKPDEPEPEHEPGPDDKLEPKPDKTEEPDSDAPAGTDKADPDKKTKKPEDEAKAAIQAAQAEQDAKLQKLVDSKKYFLPINAVEQRRSKHFVVIGIVLAIILALVWGDIAADASLIHVKGIKPVTHFFSN